MTIDEELSLLDDNIRRLKIEYDIYFGGGSKKPPSDLEWRVQSTIKKFDGNRKLNLAQRFKYNSISNKYSLYNGLWQQKLRVREEGYRRPQDALLGVQGVRQMAEEVAQPDVYDADESAPVRLQFTDPERESDKARALYDAMVEARSRAGAAGAGGTFEAFQQFLKKKTEQIRDQQKCSGVEYSVEIENGQPRLKAKAKA